MELDDRDRYRKGGDAAVKGKILPERRELYLKDSIPEKKSEEW